MPADEERRPMPSAARILIVEDEVIVARDLQEQLTRLGYGIAGRAGGADGAVELAREQRPDLVLMDIRLDGQRDGIDAAKIIQADLGLPVVYLTAHTDDGTLDR